MRMRMKEDNKYRLMSFCIISVIVLIANSELVSLGAIMKWDIADFHLPIAQYISNCIKHGTLPLWNPMINYGYPQYAQAGTPLWYPVTLLFCLFGYNVFTMHLEYMLHLILAGFFMYLFVSDYLNSKVPAENQETYSKGKLKDPTEGKQKTNIFIISLISGIIYCFSGMFISNAQHIMIIASCTWMPLMFLLLRRYIVSNKKKYLFYSGLVISMNILGGYPGIFFIIFIVLIPYIVFEYSFICNNKISMFVKALKTYLLVSVLTVCASAVTLIPFLNASRNITRGAMGYDFIKYGSLTLKNLISMLIPGTAKYHTIIDPLNDLSMMNMFTGLLVVVFAFYIIYKRNKTSSFFVIMGLFALIMSLGSNGGLHYLFFKFVPFFNTFRFPAIWRIFIAVFLILGFAVEARKLIDTRDKKDLKVLDYVFDLFIVIICIFLVVLFTNTSLKTQLGSISDINEPVFATCISLVLIVGYKFLFKDLQKVRKGKSFHYILLLLVVIEVVSFQRFDFFTTVVEQQQSYINYIKEGSVNKDSSVDFSKSKIVSIFPRISNREIINNKLFEEEGYTAFNFTDKVDYNHSYNRFIAETRPVVYFSSDVNYVKKEELSTKLNSIEIGNDKIYVVGNGKTLNKRISKEFVINTEYNNIAAISKVNGKYDIKINPYNIIQYTELLVLQIKLNASLEKDMIQNTKIEYYDANNSLIKSFDSEITLQKGLNIKYLFLPKNVDISKITFDLKDTSNVLDLTEVKMGETSRQASGIPINISKYAPNKIELDLMVKEQGFLVVQQHNYQGWEAYDNGNRVEIQDVNSIFRGLKLSPGAHVIKFLYKPVDFYIGAGISIGYLMVCVFFMAVSVYKKLTNKLI